MKQGYYFGTTINGKWWKRYKEDGFFARGNGEYRIDKEAFYFYKYLTKTILKIPLNKIIELKTGRWHAGRWSGGYPILKIVWQKKNFRLESGFILTKDRIQFDEIIDNLKEKINKFDQ